ncbi:hypothetical protein GCM10009687_06080 [Asanoa iriomotensis]|uniref:Uncharacterized protein n=1 Tax=Asanoa iriomotensis TaxID=234613 RepID=A0ABQ4C1K3_9ACTN|nr:hypothetical protein Air01nite_27540 [Asanoa iriomotensis]
MTDDEAVCDDVSWQLDEWVGLADEIDKDWLAHARSVYREPRRTPRSSTRRRPRPSRRKPLWIGMNAPTNETLSPTAEAARKQLVRRYGARTEVGWWFLRRGDERLVSPGQGLVLVNHATDRAEPHGNALAGPPAKVVRVDAGDRQHPPVAFYIEDPILEPRRFADVRRAVENAGATVDWDAAIQPGQVGDAVYALWYTDGSLT